jgi:hypothetical protein
MAEVVFLTSGFRSEIPENAESYSDVSTAGSGGREVEQGQLTNSTFFPTTKQVRQGPDQRTEHRINGQRGAPSGPVSPLTRR